MNEIIVHIENNNLEVTFLTKQNTIGGNRDYEHWFAHNLKNRVVKEIG